MPENETGVENTPPVETKAVPLDAAVIEHGTISAILQALAKEQIAAQGKVEWNQPIHCAAVVRLLAAYLGVKRDDSRMRRLYAIGNEKGFLGNSSQFQQWLASDDGGNILPAKEKKSKALADSLLA